MPNQQGSEAAMDENGGGHGRTKSSALFDVFYAAVTQSRHRPHLRSHSDLPNGGWSRKRYNLRNTPQFLDLTEWTVVVATTPEAVAAALVMNVDFD